LGVDPTVIEELLELETAMWTMSTRSDRAWTDAHLSPTSTEIGRSGRSDDRDEILGLRFGPIDAELPLRDVPVRPLGSDSFIVTDRTIGSLGSSRRASVRVRTDVGWMLEFHQGTPTAP
jgi:hypothetical protein